MATLNNTIRDASATSNVLTAENSEFYAKTLLSRLLPTQIFSKYASKPSMTRIPKNAGDTIYWNRFNSLALVTTPLVEGVTPDGLNLAVNKVTATVVQYGAWLRITDQIDMMALDPVLTEASELLGEQAGQSTEKIIGDTIFAGTTLHRAAGVAARNLVATTISEKDILAAVGMLKKANVKPLANGDYIAFVPIKVAQDIMGLEAWVKANTYRHDGLVQGAVGKLYGVQFVEISELYVTKYAGAGATSKDVFASLFMGKDYFGIPDVEGSAKPKMIVKPLGSGDDPLNQRATAGWKNLYAVKRLNEACAVRVETL